MVMTGSGKGCGDYDEGLWCEDDTVGVRRGTETNWDICLDTLENLRN